MAARAVAGERVLGFAATIVVTIWVTKVARDALKKTADVK